MSATFAKIRVLVHADAIRVSQHALRRLVAHAVSTDDLIAGIDTAEVLEDYPGYHDGPAALVLRF